MKPAKRSRIERIMDYYGNGKVRFRGSYKEGKMHGAWTFYRLDGFKMRSGSFTLGKQSGTWSTFDRQGKLVKVTKFKK